MDRQQFAQLIGQLDQPDVVTKQKVEDRLVENGHEHLEALGASLGLYTEPRVLMSLITVLKRIGSSASLLPLMRFIFDNQTRIAVGDARAVAMQTIASIAKPEHAERLFDFLMDVLNDDDPFVRGYATTALAKFGDRRAIPFIRERAADEHEFVRERALTALRALEAASSDALRQDISDNELVDMVIASAGPDREFYVEELRRRDNPFDLAVSLVHRGSRGRLRGLQVMAELADARARSVVTRLLDLEVSDAERALSLRILSKAMDRDASATEISVIENAIRHPDPFVRAAAFQAAGASGSAPLMKSACEALSGAAPEARLAAAKGLSAGTDTSHRALFPALETAVARAQQIRLRDGSEINVRVEAFIVRAIAHVLGEGALGASRGQAIALRALLDARDKRPLVVTGLELLEATTPQDGLREDDRWAPSAILGLVDIVDIGDVDIQNRAMDLLIRGARSGATEWVNVVAGHLYETDAEQMESRIIPLLELAGSRKAISLLNELTQNGDDMISMAAAAALRRVRANQEFIDAEFE